MAWNEPGGGKKDPWSSGGDQGPPDLDEVVRKIQERLGGLFGGRRRPGAGGTATPGRSLGAGLIVGILVVAWVLSGIYIVDEGRRGVVLRFGKYVEMTMPGPHWHIPFPVESVEVVDVERVRLWEVGYRTSTGPQQVTRPVPSEALMLTQDENIVDVRLAVQYKVRDAKDYLFSVRDPDATVRQVTESAVREVVGKSKMDFVLTEGRAEVVAETQKLMQQILDSYHTGVQVLSVNLQDAQPPEEVQDAFADAIKAREDEQRLKNEAQAYANEVIPKARGASARVLEEANAYKSEVVAQSEGETARFLQMLGQYEKAPAVTRERLYIESMESVLSRSGKLLVDVRNSNQFLYLPLDKLMGQQSVVLPPASAAGATAEPTMSTPQDSGRAREVERVRRVR